MDLQHAIELIRSDRLITDKASTWADLGCGTGLFTRALAHFLAPGSLIYAVDARKSALSKLEPPTNSVKIEKLKADFVKEELPFQDLDGILMANALHFVRDQEGFVALAGKWLQPNGCFLLVEYNTDKANPWVPYPLSFATLQKLFEALGYGEIEKLGERPSIYHRASIYAALVRKN
jgi:SAM-dependent methyltransferase